MITSRMLTGDDLAPRLSCRSAYPGWCDYLQLRSYGYDVDVLLDGEKVDNCQAADRLAGEVIVRRRTVAGTRVDVTYSGRVEFRPYVRDVVRDA